MLRDQDGRLSVHDLQNPDISRQFVRLPDQPSLGYIDGAAWLRIQLERPASSSKNWWLEIRAPLLDEVKLFIPQPQGDFIIRSAGTEHPFSERDIPYRNPIFSLELPEDFPKTFYLRIQGNNNMAISLIAFTPAAFASHMNADALMIGLYVAVHLVVMINSLWLYRATRDAGYCMLTILIFLGILSFSAQEGLAVQYIHLPWPNWIDGLVAASWMSSTPLYAMVMLRHLDLLPTKIFSWTWYYLAMSWVIAAASIFIALAGEFSASSLFFQGWSLVNVIALPILLIFLIRKGNSEAYVLLLPTAILWLGTLLRISRNVGILPSGTVQDYSHYIGLMAHVLAMSYAASQRYLHLRQAKENAQKELLNFLKAAKSDLELQVTQRTSDLKNALVQVQASLGIERQAQEDQRHFFQTVSHELRTPLAIIDAAARNLTLDATELDVATLKRAEKIQRATTQLATLIENCFHEHRFEYLNRGPLFELTDIDQLLHEVRDSALMQSPHHQFQLDVGELPFLWCDPEMTLLAISTLIGNSIKYTPAGSRILIRGSVRDKMVLLEICDNGPGVSPEDFPNLFRRYYRGKNSRSIPGTGLGLPLARELIQIQGGALEIAPMSKRGFCILMYLPMASDHA